MAGLRVGRVKIYNVKHVRALRRLVCQSLLALSWRRSGATTLRKTTTQQKPNTTASRLQDIPSKQHANTMPNPTIFILLLAAFNEATLSALHRQVIRCRAQAWRLNRWANNPATPPSESLRARRRALCVIVQANIAVARHTRLLRRRSIIASIPGADIPDFYPHQRNLNP